MKKIGITGGIAMGKSTVLKIIKKNGYQVEDCDAISRRIFDSRECQQWLQDNRPETITNSLESELITRDKVRNWMYCYSEWRIKYIQFINPLIRAEMITCSAQILEVPLLVEHNLMSMFENIWVVDCTPSFQRERLLLRCGGFDRTVMDLMKHQVSREERKKVATFVIDSELDLGKNEQIIAKELEKVFGESVNEFRNQKLYGSDEI